jgi:hypothetical protein
MFMVVPFTRARSGPRTALPRGFCPALVVLSALAVLETASMARADVIQTFYLKDVNFIDGGSATGSFTLDESAGQPYNVAIIITDPVLSASPLFGISPITFLDVNLSSAFENGGGTVRIFSYDDGYTGLGLTPVDPFGTTNVDLSTSSAFSYDGNSRNTTFAAGGSLSTSAVPEPASLPVLLEAVGALLVGRRWLRHRRHTT